MHLRLPRPATSLVITAQASLGLLLLVGVGTITLLPGVSSSIAADLPEYASLRDPLLAITIALAGLGLIALALIAVLVHRIHTESMLTRPALRWVDALVIAFALAAALIVTGLVTMSNAQAGNPLIALVLVVICLTLVTLACITLVLRSLLRSAILMHSELSEVI